MDGYRKPEQDAKSFHCPHCNVLAQQYWTYLKKRLHNRTYKISEYRVSCCEGCRDVAIWRNKKLIHPPAGLVQPPISEMPDDIKTIYDEAHDIVRRSPRSACVLLRLCVQLICEAKKADGGNLNSQIGYLVKKGMDERIQKALDAVRVIGNNASHERIMYMDDTEKIAIRLFGLVNSISDWAFRQDTQLDEIYDNLPSDSAEAIEKRDKST